MTGATTSPYLMEEQPTSSGRVLLARAFEHWCGLHYGLASGEIAAALDPAAISDAGARRDVAFAARLLGELLAKEGELRSSARPFGGGSPVPLKLEIWERDDFRPVFARSAIDLAKPFDTEAAPTHWVFLDIDDFNRVVDLSCSDVLSPAPDRSGATPIELPSVRIAATDRGGDDHVRMPELERRTGMSRATIYRRIKQGRFPESIPMDGNIASWRESEVAEWLANPR